MCTESMHIYMYVHVSLHWSFLTNRRPGGRPANLSLVAGIRTVAIHMAGLSLTSSNYPAILEQLQCPICLIIVRQTQIIVQQVEDMRQSVETMVRIKQTLI